MPEYTQTRVTYLDLVGDDRTDEISIGITKEGIDDTSWSFILDMDTGTLEHENYPTYSANTPQYVDTFSYTLTVSKVDENTTTLVLENPSFETVVSEN